MATTRCSGSAELLDDEIESIRAFDPNQIAAFGWRSTIIELLPGREVPLDDAPAAHWMR